jgi:hypothetical protein
MMQRQAWIAQQHGRKAVLYVVRVYSEDEAFYKVGVTFDLARRFSRLKTLYKWRTVARYSSYNAGRVWDLEQRLHKEFTSFSYLPTASFEGHTECYSECEAILAALPKSTFFLRPVGDIL